MVIFGVRVVCVLGLVRTGCSVGRAVFIVFHYGAGILGYCVCDFARWCYVYVNK